MPLGAFSFALSEHDPLLRHKMEIVYSHVVQGADMILSGTEAVDKCHYLTTNLVYRSNIFKDVIFPDARNKNESCLRTI